MESRKIILLNVFSVKGGVGKTTISLLLSSFLAHQKGIETTLVDLNLDGVGLLHAIELKPNQPLLQDFLHLAPSTIASKSPKFVQTKKNWGQLKIVPSDMDMKTRDHLGEILDSEFSTHHISTTIATLCHKWINESDDSSSAVVIDHSPGNKVISREFTEPKGDFVNTLNEELHFDDYPTKIEHKNLLVASVDPQDISAVNHYMSQQFVRENSDRFFVLFNNVRTDPGHIMKIIKKSPDIIYPNYLILGHHHAMRMFDAFEPATKPEALPKIRAGLEKSCGKNPLNLLERFIMPPE
jgi:hypothetical protein